jgi:putative membrane protein
MRLLNARKELWMMAAAVVIWAAACAVAMAQQGPAGAGQDQPGSMNQQGPAALPSPSMPEGYTPDTANPETFADQSFLRTTLEDNLAEEQMGQLAAQKSQSADVKEIGQKMAQICQQLTGQIMPLAKKLGVTQPKEPSKKTREEIKNMQTLAGPDFDSAFLRTMLRDQKSDLKEFKDEERSQNPNLQRLAKTDEPVLNDHLQILERIAQSHNVSEQSSK